MKYRPFHTNERKELYTSLVEKVVNQRAQAQQGGGDKEKNTGKVQFLNAFELFMHHEKPLSTLLDEDGLHISPDGYKVSRASLAHWNNGALDLRIHQINTRQTHRQILIAPPLPIGYPTGTVGSVQAAPQSSAWFGSRDDAQYLPRLEDLLSFIPQSNCIPCAVLVRLSLCRGSINRSSRHPLLAPL